MMLRYAVFFLIFFVSSIAASPIVNVLTWSGYLPDTIINQFEKETGIQVNITTFNGNDELYAKLKINPHAGYDLVMPSSYNVARMQRENMLVRLDKKKIINKKYINKQLLNRQFDLRNQYSVPYVWGTTGIMVNKKYWNPTKIFAWSDLWGSQFRNQLLMLDDTREVFSIALLALGYPINDQNPRHIKQAYEKLRALMPNIKIFNSDAITNLYIDEDMTIGIAWSGNANMARRENKNLIYIYPHEGVSIWIDNMVIPKYAPHQPSAYRLINFLLRPNIAKEINAITGEATMDMSTLCHQGQKSCLRLTHRDMKKRQFQNTVGSARTLYQKYWQRLKLGI